ncbi:beta-ketoacyl synthase N-terminal-like domain-containing protein [Flavobacterium cerinum]|uniref:Beta-ketoacyl synthase n=1 Tax=Flavobacterium cerinum TaxID=2502784 RepID=A0ABY5IYR2_9FLAO|nr:beta-ketoacyl synthase N-terminal-like domain-containing protein [Flavobacterium cerinum]UUC46474.1 beta-ketoacyl synthase [Flavobacterium cerinum]
MKNKIAITALGSVSALGDNPKSVWESYLNPESLIRFETVGETIYPVAMLSAETKRTIDDLRKSDVKYKTLDDSVLYAVAASRKAVEQAGWKDGHFGINIGSSRGATQLFEKYHREFLETGATATLASPTTTLGNIASWVANDLNNDGPDISHSITCSTALHALLNGVAWLESGMADKFLVGGSEAPLTPFTLAQMKAMKIYSVFQDAYPCKAFDFDKKSNSMVLGEGAAMACLETGEKTNALAYVEGVGYATELLQHNVSISSDAECFQKSMKMALKGVDLTEVDVVVMHAPGTIKGDLSEKNAIEKVFGNAIPLLTTNKWKIGHTFGSSGMLSVELAILMLQQQQFIGIPYCDVPYSKPAVIRKVLVNAVGFGGNAVSVLLSK